MPTAMVYIRDSESFVLFSIARSRPLGLSGHVVGMWLGRQRGRIGVVWPPSGLVLWLLFEEATKCV